MAQFSMRNFWRDLNECTSTPLAMPALWPLDYRPLGMRQQVAHIH